MVGLLLMFLVNCLVSLRALRLLFELLVLIPLFLELLEVSSLAFLMELVMEEEPIEISALFFVEEEVDFLTLLLYCEVDMGLSSL